MTEDKRKELTDEELKQVIGGLTFSKRMYARFNVKEVALQSLPAHQETKPERREQY